MARVRKKASLLALLVLLFTACEQTRDLSPRVAEARNSSDRNLRELFRSSGVSYPPELIFIRAFKKEKILEIWARSGTANRKFTLIKKYPVCRLSGDPGPKRKEGDRQVPEGFYHIDRFNDRSQFYLSLGLNYPNSSDLVFADKEQPGSDIFIHGDCVSIGCLAMTDDFIKEIFWIAFQARENGQERIPVHIFPSNFDGGNKALLEKYPEQDAFWSNLRTGFSYFQIHGYPPVVEVLPDGKYET